jgi:hypothetical protein
MTLQDKSAATKFENRDFAIEKFLKTKRVIEALGEFEVSRR